MLRFLNRRTGMSGSLARSSTKTVMMAPMMVMAPKVRIMEEPHSYSVPPQVVMRIREAVVMAMKVAPSQSKRFISASPTRRCSTRVHTMMARMPSGMFIHMPQRQPGPSVNQPPRTGPRTEDRPKTPPMMPMNLPRSREEVTSAMMDWEEIIIKPAPKPCTARAMISSVMELAKPPRVEPTTKMAIPPM